MSPAPSPNPAFKELWTTYGTPIRAYILSVVRDSAEADDIAQETFLRVIQKLGSLRDETKVSSWLYRIATNLCHDRYRKTSRRRESVSLDESAEEVADTTIPPLEKLLEQSEMSACVQSYIEELPNQYKAVILLHDLEGMTNPEMADMLGCSTSAVKIRLHRARERLKSALETACAFSTDERGVLVCEPKPPDPIPLSSIEIEPEESEID